jgi:acetyl esterase/lipase
MKLETPRHSRLKSRILGSLGILLVLILGLGALLFAVLYAPAPSKEAYALVDTEMVVSLDKIPHFDLNNWSLLIVRPLLSRLDQRRLPAPAPQPVEKLIPGPQGAPDVKLILIDPSPGAKGRGAFVYLHGGGYVLGRADQRLPVLQRLAENCACVLVSVDYRLAPEVRFPGALEDNYAALSWTYHHADELGIDRQRIAIGGHSAGGGHAAALAIAARDRGQIPIALQVLIYPMLDDRTGSSRPAKPGTGDFIWMADQNRFGWSALLGVPAGSAQVPDAAVPARVANLQGLPPTFIGVGTLDLFFDEDMAYAARLKQAGVPVETVVVPRAYHGFDGFAPLAAASRQFSEHWVSTLKSALGADQGKAR